MPLHPHLGKLQSFYRSHEVFCNALSSAVLLMPAFPPLDLGYLAWFALLPLLHSLLRATPRQAALAAFFFGLPLHLYLNLYLSGVLFDYLGPTLAVVALFLLIAYTSLFHALFGWAVSVASRRLPAFLMALVLPALWLLTEFLRSLGFTGYNVGYLGYTQWGFPLLLGLASTYGYWGLSFIIVFFQTIIVLAAGKFLQRRSSGLLSATFALLLGTGLLLPGLYPTQNQGKSLPTLLIQGNISPSLLAEKGREILPEHYLDLTREALADNPGARLVVWPETVIDLDLRTGHKHPPALIKLAEDHNAALLYGARVRLEDSLHNTIVLLNPGDDALPVYHKQRLVPFVEFFPMEGLLNRVLDLELLLGSYTPGQEIVIFELEEIDIAGVICFESYFGDHTRQFAAAGAEHIFVLTNDAWFGRTIGLDMHAQAAAIRAAEAGVGVTQVANSGLTVSYDYRGRELLRSTREEQAWYFKELSLEGRITPYRRAGEYFVLLWAIFLALLVIRYVNLKRLFHREGKAKTP